MKALRSLRNSVRWERIRKDFPITRTCIYLDHASGGPIPHPVAEESKRYYEEHSRWADFSWKRWVRRREEVRFLAAGCLNALPEEITFVQNTSHGMNLIAELTANRGAVLTNTCEFPSTTIPWIWKKAKMVWQKPVQNRLPLDTLQSLLHPHVKTIVTSVVQYASGFRQDVAQIGCIKGNRYLAVNATQACGAMPLDVQKLRADFLITNSYKWLMAGYGGGILYVRKPLLRRLEPQMAGWRSVRNPEAMENRRVDIKRDASRYELGSPCFPVIFTLGSALAYLNRIGFDRIQERLIELTDYLVRGLEALGCEIISPRQTAVEKSGIVVFRTQRYKKLWRYLLEARIYTSLRGEGIRVAPHAYNTADDLDVLLKRVQAFTKMKP